MKILVLCEYFPAAESELITGGVEARALHLLRELAKSHSISVLASFQGPPQRRQETLGTIKVYRVGPTHPYSNEGHVATRFMFAAAAFVAGLRLGPVEIVEGFSYVTYPVAVILARIRGVPDVATIHESWTLSEWIKLKGFVTGCLGAIWLKSALAIGFQRYIAVSGITKQRLVEQGIRPEHIDVIYNGVDTELGKRLGPHKVLMPTICTSARLIASKRIDLLVRALSRIREKIPDVYLTIHGEGSQKPELERLIQELALGTHITFVGRIAAFEEVQQMRRRSRVFCLPSASEGFGMVVIEAMSLGLPVVCTDLPVFREITDGGKGAMLFDSEDPNELANRIMRLLTDDVLYESLSAAAVAHARNFAWPTLARQVELTYREAAKPR